eukprot:1158867-Pelagomonas_calceolata.AAC.12
MPDEEIKQVLQATAWACKQWECPQTFAHRQPCVQHATRGHELQAARGHNTQEDTSFKQPGAYTHAHLNVVPVILLETVNEARVHE